ncbi:MAG: chemotaxis protein CheB [Candidatus Nitrohelix vancouverensis]|uniref:protein-glutamate methylesterase n=1 Tax=Candidatus Nitrohelix vancouverensis TaxID=2705534 RepID=A0A7T0G2Y0_9BACT|nr:MAG: chemotaxis protein CheB [Candidatus Nitrohelix vancouverensis]
MGTKQYEMIVLGGSAGSFKVLGQLLKDLPAEFPVPIVVVQHVWKGSNGSVANTLNHIANLNVSEAEEKIVPMHSNIYLAPGGYHLLIETDKSFSLSIDPLVNYSRPSIDVLFQSAAEAYGQSLIGILLTGANADGAKGLKAIKDAGGLAIVQDPETAESPFMPARALEITPVDHIVAAEQIGGLLQDLMRKGEVTQ